MIVTCNECESSFNVDDSLIKDHGSKVRCSKCSSVFVIYPETPDSGIGEDDDDLRLDMVEDLDADFDSEEETEGLAIDDSEDDELPDLGDMIDFEDDEPAFEETADEGLDDLDLDLDEDETVATSESGFGEEEELDLDLDEESAAEAEESELDHVEMADSDMSDLQMDLNDLDQAEEADMGAAESGLDFDLGADDQKAVAAQDEGDELDLSDLEDLVASDASADLGAMSVDTSEDADLDLELEAEKVEPPAAEEAAAPEEPDELDMSDLAGAMDSDAEMELADTAAEASDDVDLDLTMEPEPEAEAADSGAVIEEADELDLSDLDDIVDAGEEPALEDLTAEASEDLDLDLEAEPKAEEPMVASSADLDGADELDLSDLDDIMESDEAAAAADPVDEDLELDFEVNEGAVETAPAESPEPSDQIEMSDLEKMLESDETPASGDAEEIDLDLDLESEETAEVSASAAGQTGSDDAEFLDIEKMLEEGEDTVSAEQGVEEIAELDLEAVMDEAAKAKEPELELDLDLEGDLQETEGVLDISAGGEEDLEFDLLDSDEETLQFGATQAAATQIEEGLSSSSDLGATTDDFSTDDFAETRDLYGQTDAIDPMRAGITEAVKKRRTRKPILVGFLLLLLCLIGYIVTQNLGIRIPYVSDINIPYISDLKIPYLSGLMKSKSQDTAGNLKIAPMGQTITHKFIENTTGGKIFVITGQVRNEYDHPRSNIKITGKLYRRGKALVKTATVYGGNVLTDSDLTQMDIAAINKRLQNRFGDNRSNIKVKTGRTLPFLIIFNKLPGNLDEYTVEVSGSSSS
jgi:predicted Zn finger-like uncharacterized protein